ncbi:hypothetical protein CR513_27316, partial [Mucuna pruriens]
MPLHPFDQDSLGQQDPIRVSDDRQFLHPMEDKTTVHISGTPPVEWTGRGGQQSYPKGTKEAARRGEREVGRRAPLVLRHNSLLFHQRNTFPLDFQHGGDNSSRDRRAVTPDRFIPIGRERGRTEGKLGPVVGGLGGSAAPRPGLKVNNKDGQQQQTDPNLGGPVQSN